MPANRLTLCAVVVLLVAGCTGNKFVAKNFSAKTKEHKLIAVLPFEIIYTAHWPQTVTEKDIYHLKESEALAFQKSYSGQLNHQSSLMKRPVQIDIQPVHETNRLLKEAGMNLADAAKKSPNDICKKLGVDAVIITSVEKRRVFTQLDSFGIMVDTAVVEKLRSGSMDFEETPQIPSNVHRLYAISAISKLVNGADSTLLWSYRINIDNEWINPAHVVIPMLCRRFANKFPYRKRD